MAVAEREKVTTLERGNIFFFYRPQEEKKEPESIVGGQRLYMVLSPENKERLRLTIIGGKKLTEESRTRQRFWGAVDLVCKSPNTVRDELSGEKYRTKTRKERPMPAAHPAGEGAYRLFRHGSHTHLAYALEPLEHPGDVQKELQIEPEGSYIIGIKNPKTPSIRVGWRPFQRAGLPRPFVETFHGRPFTEADPPGLLNQEGVEFVLITAAEDAEEELGLSLDPEEENVNRADILSKLKLDLERRPIEPLFAGKWE